MKNGQISRNPGCKAGLDATLHAMVDFVRIVGTVMFCYQGNRQVACVPANSTPDMLRSSGLDLEVLRMIREEELAAAQACAVSYLKEIQALYDKREACLAAANATQLELQLGLPTIIQQEDELDVEMKRAHRCDTSTLVAVMS